MKKMELNVLHETMGGERICNDVDLAYAVTGAALSGAWFFGPVGAIGAVIGTVAYIKLAC